MPTFDLATAAATTRHTSAEPPIPHDHVRGANYAGGPVAMSLRGSRRELEADRLAARIVQSGGSDTAVRVMRESSDTLAGRTAPNYVADAITSPGAPLADETRRTMEAGFGHDFSGVRVHTNATASRATAAVGASAYTIGSDIVFGAGRYQPGNQQGDRLIAHELVHVLQQRDALLSVQCAPDKPAAIDAELELGERLRGPGFANGYALAFYDEDEPEAERRAKDFALREAAIGVKGTKITGSSPKMDCGGAAGCD